MSLYIANPRNPEAKALLDQYHGRRPYTESFNGPVGGIIWAVVSAVLGVVLLMDDSMVNYRGWAVLFGVSMVGGLIWAMAEYEPLRRHRIRQFDEFVASGEIIDVSVELETALRNHRRVKDKLYDHLHDMLAHCYVELLQFQRSLNEVRAQGKLDKAGEQHVARKIREFIDQCVVAYRQRLAEQKAHEAAEQSIRSDWATKRL